MLRVIFWLFLIYEVFFFWWFLIIYVCLSWGSLIDFSLLFDQENLLKIFCLCHLFKEKQIYYSLQIVFLR